MTHCLYWIVFENLIEKIFVPRGGNLQIYTFVNDRSHRRDFAIIGEVQVRAVEQYLCVVYMMSLAFQIQLEKYYLHVTVYFNS